VTTLRVLTALCRLRRVETDSARRDLSEALAGEIALAAREAVVQRQIEEALAVTGDFDRQAFALWFGRMRTEQTELGQAMQAADAQTRATRTALAHRRVAETAAETALGQEITARAAEVARREQVALEDAARASRWAANEGRRPG
jgi:hypothetical protein